MGCPIDTGAAGAKPGWADNVPAGVPHTPQNFVVGWTGAPQLPQNFPAGGGAVTGSGIGSGAGGGVWMTGVPQSPQNFSVPAIGLPQPPHVGGVTGGCVTRGRVTGTVERTGRGGAAKT